MLLILPREDIKLCDHQGIRKGILSTSFVTSPARSANPPSFSCSQSARSRRLTPALDLARREAESIGGVAKVLPRVTPPRSRYVLDPHRTLRRRRPIDAYPAKRKGPRQCESARKGPTGEGGSRSEMSGPISGPIVSRVEPSSTTSPLIASGRRTTRRTAKAK